MARNGKQSPGARWRQVKIAKDRGGRKAARAHKRYVPHRWSHKPTPNPGFRLHGKPRGRTEIEVPTNLDFKESVDWNSLIDFLNKLRTAALSGSFKKVILDFTEVASLSPEAAVTIVAEIQRCRAFCKSRTNITGTYPKSPEVSALLIDVGFFKALGVKAPELPKSFTPRSYLQIIRGNSVVAEVADTLLDCFSEVFDFHPADRKRLHVALIECMDNVFQHAYPRPGAKPYLIHEWWLAGYADRDQGIIEFTFYDQGSGIPATIKTRQRKRLRERLPTWSDGRWIERAIKRGISRHGSRRRGFGLEKLREFVNQLAVNGSLNVLANSGGVVFNSDGNSEVHNLSHELNGTLVKWQLRGIKDIQMPESADVHIEHRNEQSPAAN